MPLLIFAFVFLSSLVYSHALKQDFFTGFNDQTNFQIHAGLFDPSQSTGGAVSCPQTRPLHPQRNHDLSTTLEALYNTSEFKSRAYGTLAGAVRIPTESYDVMGPVGEDPRWKTFDKLHEFFEDRFAKLYSQLHITKVNTYGLVFHWQGSDTSLLPILLTAHQDVVPVDPATALEWKYPPYSGHFDDTWIWGRGSCDDKSSMIAILIAVEELLEHGFKPARTIVLAFGFDEESAGTEGAGHLAQYLEDRYGRNGFATLLDEGAGLSTIGGGDVLFALPSTSEKGYMDVLVEVSTPGGHSSVPPEHTSIGILSSAIVAIESSKHTPELLRNGTPFATIQCVAAYSPNIPEKLRKLIGQAAEDDNALETLKFALLHSNPQYAAAIRTTQAVDLIQGGVKANALPETASAVINHRIAEHSSVADVKQHLSTALRPLAVELNLTLDAFGVITTAGSGLAGRLKVSKAFTHELEPSPITPSGSSEPFRILSGTIKAVLENSDVHPSSATVVTPSLSLGNTDTQFYWNLTKHIFRYSHLSDTDAYNGMHTVNEAVRAESVIEEISFITTFILNWDEAEI